MAFIEKCLGYVIIPTFLLLLIIQKLGIFPKTINYWITKVCTFKVFIGFCFWPLFLTLAGINMIMFIRYYKELSDEEKPFRATPDAIIKGYEKIYMIYRNMVLNLTSGLLIILLYYNSILFQKFQERVKILDELKRA